jgi:hypothetical protein
MNPNLYEFDAEIKKSRISTVHTSSSRLMSGRFSEKAEFR